MRDVMLVPLRGNDSEILALKKEKRRRPRVQKIANNIGCEDQKQLAFTN
jgi:hypothetical protein